MKDKNQYQLSVAQSKRLNILKMILAIFVVYIHSVQQEVRISGTNLFLELPIWFKYFTFSISTILARCAVPGFFFISSVLLYRKEFIWLDNIKKKTTTLIIPYLLINTFWIVLFAIFQSIPQISFLFNDPDNLISNFTFKRWLAAFGIDSLYPFLGPLWFLRNLFLLNLTATALKKCIDSFPKTILFILIIMWIFVPNGYVNFINTSDICMWCFGYYVIKYNISLDYFDNKRIALIFSFVSSFIICLLIKAFSFEYLDLQIERISIIITLVFCYSVITYNLDDSINKILLKYSKYSFGIYIFHEMAIVFTKKIIAKIFGVSLTVQIIQYLIMPISIIILSIVICKIMNKFFPGLYSLITGFRSNFKVN